MKNLHSMWTYVLLAGLIISILYLVNAYLNNKAYNRKMALLGLVSVHIQFVIGLITYFVSPYGIKNVSSAAMKDGIARLYFLEHPLTMLVAVILITVGYSTAKRQTDPKKQNRTAMIYYSIGLVLILSRIPWHAWPNAT